MVPVDSKQRPAFFCVSQDAQRQHVVFDLDGTLVDSNAVCVTLLQEMLDERGSGAFIDPEAARPFMSKGGVHMISGLLGDHCGDPDEELAEFRRRYLEHQTGTDTLFDGVAAGLGRLVGAGYRLSICSNKPQSLCEKVLIDTGLAPLFDVVVGGRVDVRSKPHPDLLNVVTDALDVTAAQCFFVGDSELDYRVARDARIPFAFMTYGYAHPGWLPQSEADWDASAGRNFSHFDDLIEVLVA